MQFAAARRHLEGTQAGLGLIQAELDAAVDEDIVLAGAHVDS